jgi:hypothetical protein
MSTEIPKAALAEPNIDSHWMETFNNLAGFPQYVSPSYWLGEAMGMICGCNPFEWWGRQIAGDWKAVVAASVALDNLGKFNADYANAIRSFADPLFREDWLGKAATGADQYFDSLTAILHNQVEPLHKTSKGFSDVAMGVLQAADAIKSLLETLGDYLIAIGIEIAAGVVVGWTVVGTLVVGAAIAAQVWQAYRTWKLVLDIWDGAWLGIQATLGLIMGYLSPLRAVEMQQLPRASYDHPGV